MGGAQRDGISTPHVKSRPVNFKGLGGTATFATLGKLLGPARFPKPQVEGRRFESFRDASTLFVVVRYGSEISSFSSRLEEQKLSSFAGVRYNSCRTLG
jgi:hypothetical protein